MRVYEQPKDTWIGVPFPPLVDEQTWDRVRVLKKRRLLRAKRNTELFYMLQQIVTCAECGRLMGARTNRTGTTKHNGKTYAYELDPPRRYYQCYGMNVLHLSCRKKAMIKAERLEELVWGEVKGIIQHPEIIVAGIESLDTQEDGGWEKWIADAERDLNKVQLEEDRAIRLYVSCKVTEDQLDHQRRFITERLETLRDKLDEYRAQGVHGRREAGPDGEPGRVGREVRRGPGRPVVRGAPQCPAAARRSGLDRRRQQRQHHPRYPNRRFGVHCIPAIVTKAQFRRVGKHLSSRAPKFSHPRRVGSSYLLSGLVKCQACNTPLTGQFAKSGQYSYYVCQSNIKLGNGACETPRLNARHFEEMVVAKIRANILTEGSIRDLVKVVDEEMDGVAREQRKTLRTIETGLAFVTVLTVSVVLSACSDSPVPTSGPTATPTPTMTPTQTPVPTATPREPNVGCDASRPRTATPIICGCFGLRTVTTRFQNQETLLN